MAIREQAKAIVGAGIAGLTALGTALADGQVTQLEWTGVALAALLAYGGVFGVRNAGAVRLPALTSQELLELAERAAEREHG